MDRTRAGERESVESCWRAVLRCWEENWTVAWTYGMMKYCVRGICYVCWCVAYRVAEYCLLCKVVLRVSGHIPTLVLRGFLIFSPILILYLVMGPRTVKKKYIYILCEDMLSNLQLGSVDADSCPPLQLCVVAYLISCIYVFSLVFQRSFCNP